MSGPPEITLFFGRLHPLLVHLPIGLLFLLVCVEVLGGIPRLKPARAGVGLILALAAPAALAAALCGWLLSRAGGYDDHLLQWHKWTGIATAGFCLLAACLYGLDCKKSYRWSLFAGFFVLVLASHFGGSLTHGSDYLTRYAPQPLRSWLGGGRAAGTGPAEVLDPARASAFSAVIQPIISQKCVACHGPAKSKGGLRLDSYAALVKGGDSGPLLVPGNSAASLFLKRLLIPAEEENHMPPEGKPQPSPDDLTLFRWWIDAGAAADAKVAEMNPTADVARIIAARSGASKAAPYAPSSPATNPAPVNAQRPVSRKPADSTKTSLYDGLAVAFCGGDCKARFQRDPDLFLAKIDAFQETEK